MPWSSRNAVGVAPGAVATAQGLRQLVGNVLRLAEGHLGNGGPVDEFGFDPEFNSRFLMPVARFFYQRWFRVQIRGLENVPARAPPWWSPTTRGRCRWTRSCSRRGCMTSTRRTGTCGCWARTWCTRSRCWRPWPARAGTSRRAPANADALLRAGELVGVFPEGFKGIGKPFAERYHLQRFGRGGFAATAIRARVPLIPCAIVGAEEIYPMIGNAKQIAELLRLPYFPITPLFPWLGPGRHGAAAVPVDHRVLPAGADQRLRARR